MQNKQTRRVQSFVRVDAWFAAHPELFPAGDSTTTALAKQRSSLADVVTRVTANAAAQSNAQRQTTLASKDELALRKHLRGVDLRAIVRMAKALARTIPGISSIKLPGSTTLPATLLDAARSIRTAAAVYEQVLIEHGLPADFLARLDQSIAALQQSVNARTVATTEGVNATNAVASDINLGQQIVAMMDASLSHVLSSNSVALASWRQAKRVTAKSVAGAGTAVTAQPAVGTGGSTASTPGGSAASPANGGTQQ